MERVKGGEVPRACGRDQLGSCWCRKAEFPAGSRGRKWWWVGEQQEMR